MPQNKKNWEEDLFNLSNYYLKDDRVRLDIDQIELEIFIRTLLQQVREEPNNMKKCTKELAECTKELAVRMAMAGLQSGIVSCPVCELGHSPYDVWKQPEKYKEIIDKINSSLG